MKDDGCPMTFHGSNMTDRTALATLRFSGIDPSIRGGRFRGVGPTSPPRRVSLTARKPILSYCPRSFSVFVVLTCVVLSSNLQAKEEQPSVSASEAVSTISLTRRLMGVSWTITAHATDAVVATVAVRNSLDEVERLERVLSDYDPASELSRLSASSPGCREVGDDLWRVLESSERFRECSNGAFDPTVGPLTALWRQSRRSGRLPDPDKLSAAREACGPATLVLDAERRSVRLTRPGMRLDLGGIGMGFAADAAMRMLRKEGIDSAMIDASGDILVSGPPPGRRAWRVAVERLRSAPLGLPAREDALSSELTHIDLVDAAVTTSGDAYQALEVDGVRYGHVIDPRTGLGVRGPRAVTVVARDCTTADAAATAACVLGPVDGLRMIDSLSGASAMFQWVENGRLMRKSSSDWPKETVLDRSSNP